MLCDLFQDGFERPDVPLPGMPYLSFSNSVYIEHDDDCNGVRIHAQRSVPEEMTSCDQTTNRMLRTYLQTAYRRHGRVRYARAKCCPLGVPHHKIRQSANFPQRY